MRTYKSVIDYVEKSPSVVTIGTFDGVHQGHAEILEKVINRAKEKNLVSVLLTFWPHPRIVLDPNSKHKIELLQTLEEKIERVEEIGIDRMLVLPFTHELSNMSPDAFVDDILIHTLNTKELIIGYDHRFGKDREGGFEYLSRVAPEFGFNVEEIPRVDIDKVGVSSTNIREHLKKGEVFEAANLLGRPYSLQGKVISGQKRGRLINFPTANLGEIESIKLIPKSGVYVVRVECKGQTFHGMMNLGGKPTFEESETSVEVHIFDLERDLYGKLLKIEFLERIRETQKFSGLEELKQQLVKDKTLALDLISKYDT